MSNGLFGLGFDLLGNRPAYPPRTGEGKNDLLTVGNSSGAVSLQAAFGEVDQFTVQIDVDTTSVDVSQHIVKTVASVSLKVGGNTIKRVYDVTRGLSISGNAEAVLVDVNDASPTPSAVQQYRVTITVGRFPRAGGPVPPVRTGFYGSIAASPGEQIVAVPPGANGVVVYGSPFAGLTLDQIGYALPAVPTVMFSTVATPGQFVPLVSGAAYVRVSNASAAPTNVTIVFTVDG